MSTMMLTAELLSQLFATIDRRQAKVLLPMDAVSGGRQSRAHGCRLHRQSKPPYVLACRMLWLRTEGSIGIVEGEKCALALKRRLAQKARNHMGRRNVNTWHLTDWTPLAGLRGQPYSRCGLG